MDPNKNSQQGEISWRWVHRIYAQQLRWVATVTARSKEWVLRHFFGLPKGESRKTVLMTCLLSHISCCLTWCKLHSEVFWSNSLNNLIYTINNYGCVKAEAFSSTRPCIANSSTGRLLVNQQPYKLKAQGYWFLEKDWRNTWEVNLV